MTTVRTGGQYSLVRAALGLSLAAYVLWFALVRRPELAEQGVELHPFTFLALGLLALLVAFGRHDRWAGLALGALWYGLHASLDELPDPGVIAVLVLLALNACLPRAPYGSWDARGRVDPDGGWRAPVWVFPLALVFLALGTLGLSVGGYLAHGFTWQTSAAAVLALFLFVPRARPWAWCGLFGLSLAFGWLAFGDGGASFGPTVFLLFVFDPAWVAPVRRAQPVRVFYDGDCVLCHGFVRFALAEDRAGALRFAPLAGPTFERELAAAARAGLPDSVVVLDEVGRPLVRSEGVRHVLATLGGWWRVFALALACVPRPLRDLVYDATARVRKSVFGSTKEACPLMPRELAARFDP